RRKRMRLEKQNGGATASRPRTIYIRESALRPKPFGSSRAAATPAFRFQKDGSAEGEGARECRSKRQSNYCGLGIWDLEFPEVAGLASGAKKDRGQKKARTIHNCIAR